MNAHRPGGPPSRQVSTRQSAFPQLPPLVIDLSPYWRPPGFAAAVVVVDALICEGAGGRAEKVDRQALARLVSSTTTGQKTILAALELPEPPRFFDFTVLTD